VSRSNSRSSLARSTLTKIGERIAVVIALTTLVSYLHLLRSIRAGTLANLEKHVSERSQCEQGIFVLAVDTHALLKQSLEERIRAGRQEDPSARFDRLFAPLPDGTIRNQPQGFDGTRMPGLWVARGVTADTELRRRILAAYDLLAQYGPVLHVRFTDTYIMFPEGVNLVYWPESPQWSQNVEPTFPLVTFEYFTISLPANNPQRGTVWTGIYLDEPSRKWMGPAITPLDMEGRHVATIGHDVLLNELMERTLNDHLPGAYNVIFQDDGQLIAHPGMKLDSGASAYNILDGAGPAGGAGLGTEEQRAHLRSISEDQVAAGDFKVSLDTSRGDELGRLAQGFELMAQEGPAAGRGAATSEPGARAAGGGAHTGAEGGPPVARGLGAQGGHGGDRHQCAAQRGQRAQQCLHLDAGGQRAAGRAEARAGEKGGGSVRGASG
jgi:hypothetical protein